MFVRESIKLGDKELSIEVGRMAKQADGAVVLRYGDAMILVTAVADRTPRAVDFMPLTVEYSERMYAAGRIPGGYFRREGRPSVNEILACRLVDRPIRPLFPEGWFYETQIIAMVLSADQANTPDVLAITGASAALAISDIPWAGPIVGLRVGRVGGRLLVNPTHAEQDASDLNIVVVCSEAALVMVEGTCRFVAEGDVVEALVFAQEQARPLLALQRRLQEEIGRPKRPLPECKKDEALVAQIKTLCGDQLAAAIAVREKRARSVALDGLRTSVIEQLGEAYADRVNEVKAAFSEVKRRFVRAQVVDTRVRIDGRRPDEIRAITGEVGVLPRTHGSALFTRGETQALVTATLATARSDQRIESIMGDYTKRFLLHYNFPPFSTGEVKRFGTPGRREIGHGNLAERSLMQVLPDEEKFPYVVRVVSEVLESNGSSSMASVCGGSLALMDAGVPIAAPVAGIAMGLIEEGDRYCVLSDILGDEDHLGDMDFKVTGTKEGVCAIQMDIKLDGLSRDVLAEALEQARQGRLHILECMNETLAQPRASLAAYAPRIVTLRVHPDRIRDIIGPGGKMIRAIQEQTKAEINVEDDGTVTVASFDEAGGQKAVEMIQGLTAEAEVGVVYRGRVRRVVEFGAFVEILPGTDGLVHISELDHQRVKTVTDVCKEGDEMAVKVINVDRDGKIRLSRKQALDTNPADIVRMI